MQDCIRLRGWVYRLHTSTVDSFKWLWQSTMDLFRGGSYTRKSKQDWLWTWMEEFVWLQYSVGANRNTDMFCQLCRKHNTSARNW